MRVQAVWVAGARTPFVAYGTDGQHVVDEDESGQWSIEDVEPDSSPLFLSRHLRRFSLLSVRGSCSTYHQQQQRHGSWHTLSTSDPNGLVVDDISLLGDDNSVLSFSVPSLNKTGYLPLVIEYYPDANYSVAPLHNFTGIDWLYYSVVECDTGFIVDDECQPCPTGGYCPGGGRVWPIPGYWSFNETYPPTECTLPQICPGALQFSNHRG